MDIEANKRIGKKLRAIRLERGLRQTEIAQALGKPQSYVSKIESGEKSLHLYEAFDYAKALGMTSEQLVKSAETSLGRMAESNEE